MARAGYCSQCGSYVYLRPDGYCVNGHTPQAVSAIYEAPDEQAPPAAFGAPVTGYASPAVQQAPPYQQPAPGYPPQGYQQPPQGYPVAAPAAKKRRGGLIVALLIVSLLLCGGGVAAGIVFGVVPNPADLLSSPAHQKAAAAGDFVEAFSTANLVLFRKSLPTDAANAANPAYWIKQLSQADTTGKLESKSWNGDELTMVFVSGDGTKQQFVFTAEAGSEKVKAIARDPADSSDAGNPAFFEMVKEAGGYKVLALVSESGEDLIRFTPDQIKKFESENP
jgi:hypothetical protein